MGLFGPAKMCALCGGKVGLLGGHKLANGLYICGDCTDKCTPGAKYLFEGMSPEDVKSNMALAVKNKKKGEDLFSTTRIFYTCYRHDKPVLEVDETHAWFKDKTNEEGWVYDLDAVSNYSMRLDSYRIDPDDKEEYERYQWAFSPEFYTRYPDLPRVPQGERISNAMLSLKFMNNELGVKELDISLLPNFFTDREDYMAAFDCCNEFFAFMKERNMYKNMQRNAPNMYGGGAPVSQSDNMDALKKMHDLLEAGIITQAEFDAKKKQLLGI